MELNFLIRTTPLSNRSLEFADQIVENRYVLSPALETIEFGHKIDWDYRHYKNQNSYQLYLHSLNMVSYLVNAFEMRKDSVYLSKALSIIESWLAYEKTNHHNDMVWYDHPTAYRTQNLVYFYCLAKGTISFDEDILRRLIQRHADYLKDDSNYRKNNHGIMMDRALIMLGVFLNEERYIDKGIWRLTENFHHSFSHQGVHLENSPAYHRLVHNLFIEIEKYLNNIGYSLGKEITDRFSLIEDYYAYIIKPNGILPIIGDTDALSIKGVNKKYESFFDRIAGITIMQAKDVQVPENSTWLAFISGYGTLTHKHYDDLSFMLYYGGEDWFTDSGKYGYGSDKTRAYMKLPLAHNSLSIDGKKYDFFQPTERFNNIDTVHFIDNAYFSSVKGINRGYKDAILERTVVFIKPDILLLYDRMISSKKRRLVQNFNLAPTVKIESINNNEVMFKSAKSGAKLTQLLPGIRMVEVSGDPSVPQAIISEKTGRIVPTSQLKGEALGKEVEILTLIEFDSAMGKIQDIKIDRDHHLLVKLHDRNFTINI